MFNWNVMILFIVEIKTIVYCRDRVNGAIIGPLIENSHNVSGMVYSPSEYQIYIRDLYYDGKAPSAFFWMGTNESFPNENGVIIRYRRSSTNNISDPLPKFGGEDVILDLPDGTNITQIKWLSIWCRKFKENMAHVTIPRDLQVPQIRILPQFSNLTHDLRSGYITILNAQTIKIASMHYDGLGPEAYFWVGTGSNPDSTGFKIPNEKGCLNVLKAYSGEDIVLHFPNNLTVYDIDYLGVWCVKFERIFGHVSIPDDMWVPPSLDAAPININCLVEVQEGSTIALVLGLTAGLLIILIIVFVMLKVRRRKHGVVVDLE